MHRHSLKKYIGRTLSALCGYILLSPTIYARPPPDTLVIGRGQDSVTLDPGTTTRASDFLPISLSYERLVVIQSMPGTLISRLEGQLAERWERSSDGRVWTFWLRPHHYFEDHSEVDATAVKATFDRIKELRRGPAQILEMLDHVEAKDRYVVEFWLKASFPVFDQLLTIPMFSIINVKASRGDLEKQAWIVDHTAGSGPYRVASWERNERMLFSVSLGEPALSFKSIRMEVIGDARSRIEQLLHGDIDVLTDPPIDWAARLAREPQVTLLHCASPTLLFLELNNTRPPFNDPRIRRAVALAIDRRSIVRGIYGDFAREVAGVLPPGTPGKDMSLPLVPFEPSAARKTLSDARFRASGTLDLLYTPRDAASNAVAVVIQYNLASIGIRVRLLSLSPSAYNDRVRFRGTFDLALRAYTADFPDPWTVLDPIYSSANFGAAGNVSRYRSAATDQLLATASVSTDAIRRLELYRAAERQISADQPNVVLFETDALLAARRDIEGVTLNCWQPEVLDTASWKRHRTSITTARQ